VTGRRGFLLQCLALAAAPAIVRADSLMRLVPRDALVMGLDLAKDDAAGFIIFVHPNHYDKLRHATLEWKGMTGKVGSIERLIIRGAR
jgi:hypothetical protein